MVRIRPRAVFMDEILPHRTFPREPAFLGNPHAAEVSRIAFPRQPFPAPIPKSPFHHRPQDGRGQTATRPVRPDPHSDFAYRPFDRHPSQQKASGTDHRIARPNAQPKLLSIRKLVTVSKAEGAGIVRPVANHPRNPKEQLRSRSIHGFEEGRPIFFRKRAKEKRLLLKSGLNNNGHSTLCTANLEIERRAKVPSKGQ